MLYNRVGKKNSQIQEALLFTLLGPEHKLNISNNFTPLCCL